MKNDNIQSNRRGSSPPFQDPEHDFYDWMKKLNSIGQRDEMAPENQRARQPGNETPIFASELMASLNKAGKRIHAGRTMEE